MRADMTFTGGEFDGSPIRATGTIHFNGMAALDFTQGDSSVTIIVPARMHSCLETIARVFNECMEAGPAVVEVLNCEAPDEPPHLVGGQYIGLTRSGEGNPWDVEIGGLTPDGRIRTGVFSLTNYGTVIVTAEVAMQATKYGWELAPEHPTSGDLVAIKR